MAGLAFGLLCAVGVGQMPLSTEHPKAGTMLGVVLLIVVSGGPPPAAWLPD